MISILKRLEPRDIRLLLAVVLCVVAFVASSDDGITACNNLADNLGVLRVFGTVVLDEIFLVNYSGPEKGTISTYTFQLEVTRTLKVGHYTYTSTSQKLDTTTQKYGPSIVGRSGSFDISAGETTSITMK